MTAREHYAAAESALSRAEAFAGQNTTTFARQMQIADRHVRLAELALTLPAEVDDDTETEEEPAT